MYWNFRRILYPCRPPDFGLMNTSSGTEEGGGVIWNDMAACFVWLEVKEHWKINWIFKIALVHCIIFGFRIAHVPNMVPVPVTTRLCSMQLFALAIAKLSFIVDSG